MTNLFA